MEALFWAKVKYRGAQTAPSDQRSLKTEWGKTPAPRRRGAGQAIISICTTRLIAISYPDLVAALGLKLNFLLPR
jgi:hypothetical protein